MVVLKEFELSVNIESISFQKKVEHLNLWLAITKSRLITSKFIQKKKVNKELCIQFRANSKFNSEIYKVNFFSSERVVINAKKFRKELLEIHFDIPKLEELYGIISDIKGATQLIQTTLGSEAGHANNNQQDNIQSAQDTNNIRNGKYTQKKNHQQNNTLGKNQTSDHNKHNEQQAKNQLFSNDNVISHFLSFKTFALFVRCNLFHSKCS